MILSEIKELIEQFDSFVIFRHFNADGDALGSTYGLKRIIEENIKDAKVYVVGSRGGYLDKYFPKSDEIPSDLILGKSLALCLDVPQIARTDLGENVSKCAKVIKIDHHLYCETYGDLEWIKNEASSACEMVGELCIDAGWKLPSDAATYIYFGLTTDAGRFLYCFTPKMFEVAKFLVENGADVANIYPFIYETTINEARFHGYCQSNFKQTPHGCAYNKLPNEVLDQFGIPHFQGAGMVNALSNMRYIDVWAHFSENDDGTIKGELRSKGLPVNEVAQSFGGGGHVKASGCTLMNWDEADICIQKLDNLILTHKPYYNEFAVAMRAIKEASKIVLDIYRSPDLGVQIKSDNSPVTKADLASDKYIRSVLSKAFPEYGILSEETEDNLERLNKEFVWIIDPIDGTKDFVNRDDEFAINIALARNGKPVLGLIAVPAKDIVYYAFENGGAFKEEKGVKSRIFCSEKVDNLIGARSRFHMTMQETKYYKQFEELIPDVYQVGSAYKFGLLAEGKVDINCKFDGNTKEWDIAPGVVLIQEAGGSFTKPDGSLYTFNRENVYNEEGYIVMNKFNKGLLK